MLQNSSNDSVADTKKTARRSWREWAMIVILPVWVLASFIAAQVVTVGVLWLLKVFHVPLDSINQNVMTTILSAFIYIVAIVLTIGLPWLIRRRQVSRVELGIYRLPLWKDILMAPAGLVVYLILSALLMLIAGGLIPGFNTTGHQDTGFSGLGQQYELILAFITLVVIAPVAEEILFRGYLFSKLRKYVPVWIAILATSILFGLIHAVGNNGDWSLAIDTFALSVVLCLLRLNTGSLWASMLLHMIKNGIAFFFLFIYPVLHGTIGG
ncbi:CPBP family intramembrane metalloprotease [Patescibacteria group bacterium]|nr:MAG: CPBP family intramembrane metalloprotease [Patescibacteria group bacterium]